MTRAWLSLFSIVGACIPAAKLDPGLVAHHGEKAVENAAGEVRFLGYTARAVSGLAAWKDGETSYSFELVTPTEAVYRAACKVSSRSSIAAGDSSSIACDYTDAVGAGLRYGLVVYGSRPDFLGQAIVNGHVDDKGIHAPKDGETAPVVVHERLAITGSGTVWNFHRDIETYKKRTPYGGYSGNCCEKGATVAGVELRPSPRVVLDPNVEPRLGLGFALAAASLLVLRDVPRLEP